MNEKQTELKQWHLSKQINVGIIVQLGFLASLIVGSWVNIQRQLDILQHDMNSLLTTQKEWRAKVDELTSKCMSYEYRLNMVEKTKYNMN